MQTTLVEIIGPPGVGKTTLYDALCAGWKPGESWIYQEALLSAQQQGPSAGQWWRNQLRQLLGKKRVGQPSMEAGLQFAQDHQELAQFCWRYLSEVYPQEALDKRFRAAHFLFQDFCRYGSMLQLAQGRLCLLHEGLLQKSFLVQPDEKEMLSALTSYLPTVPLPRAVVLVDTPNAELIVQRLKGRRKTIASHIGQSEKELLRNVAQWRFLLEASCRKLEEAGVEICRIDAAQTVVANVARIRGFLQSLGEDRATASARMLPAETEEKGFGALARMEAESGRQTF